MKAIKYLLLSLCIGLSLSALSQQPFTAGNIVVYRVGDGISTLTNTAAKVYLDEYTPAGVLVQSILMPVVTNGSNSVLTAQGINREEGILNLSVDGKYLVVPGINVIPDNPVGSTGSVIGLVDFNGKINTSTVVTDFVEGSNIPFTAISDDGNRLWFGGAGAIRYTTAGSSSSVLLNNSTDFHDLKITDGQLYVSGDSPQFSLYTVGNGSPVTANQSLNMLPGFPDPSDFSTHHQFAFADLDPTVAGSDVVYIADQGWGGIRKFSLVGGIWIDNGVVGSDAQRYAGLTLKISANVVTLFATRRGANASTIRGGELVKITDNSGYNGNFNATPTVIASVFTPNTAAFRGVALVPQPAPFTAGNIVVYRVGDGISTLTNTAAKVYLDEYTPAGVLVQSILMPVVTNGSNSVLTAQGINREEGILNLSVDGKYLVVPGINVIPDNPVGSTGSVIGLVDFNGKINTSTVVTDFVEGSNIPFTAISDDGNRLWFGGAGAIRYTTAGSSSSVLLNNSTDFHDLKITDGQLYVSGDSPQFSLYTVGNGSPVTANQSLNMLPGFPDPSDFSTHHQFAFADLDPTVAGSDVVYIADQGWGGIRKFSLVGGIWIDNGVVGSDAQRYAGLTLKISANVVTLFATRRGANASTIRGGELVKITDNSGYNGNFNATPTVIASVFTPNTAAFRGVARVPLGCPAVTGLRIPDVSSNAANVYWNAAPGGPNYEYEISTSQNPSGATTVTSNTSIPATNLNNSTTYYAHVRTVCSAISKSEWTTQSFTTGCNSPAVAQLTITSSASGTATIKWNKVFGATKYEFSVSTSDIQPVSGVAITDTFVIKDDLNPITQYYVFVRSDCGGGAFSNWIKKSFSTGCFRPTINLNILPDYTAASWNSVINTVKYEYALTHSPVTPLSGVFTTDTSYILNRLTDGADYYFHVRRICNTGAISDWTTVNFNRPGMQVYPNPITETLHVTLSGINNINSQINIYDAMGRMIKQLRPSGNYITVDTKSWARGVYIVCYRNNLSKYNLKIVKQ